jgi:integrase
VGFLPRKQRPLKLEHVPALRCMVLVAQDSAMRLREMYTLTLDQLDFTESTIFLDKTKNGHKRQVPMASTVVDAIKEYLKVRVVPPGGSKQALFPWWDGTPPSPKAKKYFEKLTSELSKLFVDIFESASCKDLGFHDLRHEATSRLFERTNLSDTEIMKITGHSSVKMLLRYANLRGSKLAARLW